MTPAFSPGPWITQGALVGRLRRCTFEDLYEQCSFHMAEKMPSSVKLGSRPISLTMRSYSSGLSPCSATSCGVIGGSLRVMADPVEHALGDGNGSHSVGLVALALCRAVERFDESSKKAASVGAAHFRLHVILRMRHHPEHVAAGTDDARNGIGCPVHVPGRIEAAVGGRIAKQHPPLVLKAR